MASSKRLDLWLMLALFAASLLLRVILLAPSHFDGLYGQDPYAYYDFAQELRQDIQAGQAPGPFFWPLGYPAMLAVDFAVVGAQPVTAQALSLALGALLTPLVYALARAQPSVGTMGVGRAGALAAAALMTLCGQALQSSIVVMADIPALALAVTSALALGRYTQNGRARWLALSAAILALACICRWLYLILAVPWTLVVLMTWQFHRGDGGAQGLAPLRAIFAQRWREAAVGLLAAALVFLPQIAYSRTNPYPTLNHAWVEGWSPANVFQREFTNIDGHFIYDRINLVYYAQPFYDPFYLSPVFAPFLVIGLATLLRRKQIRETVMLAGWALLPFAFLVGIPYQNIRFPLIVVPAVSVLAGMGLEAILVRGRNSHRRWQLIVSMGLFAAVMAVGLWQMTSAGKWLVDNFISNQQRDKDAAAWANERIPAGATVYTFGLTLTLKHYTPLTVYELYDETPQSLDNRWVRGQDDYLLINVYNVESQWAGREPQIAFHWLRDVRGLQEIGRYGDYILFLVRG